MKFRIRAEPTTDTQNLIEIIQDIFPGSTITKSDYDYDVLLVSDKNRFIILEQKIKKFTELNDALDYLRTLAPKYLQEFVED